MNGLIPDAMAQSAGGGAPGGGIAPILMMVVFIAIFYFLLIRPQQKKAKEHQAMVTKLSAGDQAHIDDYIQGHFFSNRKA